MLYFSNFQQEKIARIIDNIEFDKQNEYFT